MSDVIDWSKAPVGWDVFIKSGFFSGFYRDAGDRYERESGYYRLKEDEANYTVFRRPWSGEGLPPVGTVCEVDYCEEWRCCEVIAHFKQRVGMVAVFTVEIHDGAKSLDAFGESSFRPIRTPEQIAADDRDAAIQEMINDSTNPMDDCLLADKYPGDVFMRQLMACMYSAGYRKQ